MRPPQIWAIADTHWYHDNIALSCGRPTHHTGLSIQNWAQMVRPCDTVYHLGDVILYKMNLLAGILDSLPGTKILILGNHDQKSRTWYTKNGFAFVTDALVYKHAYISHRPVEVLPSSCTINIHGHCHLNPSPYSHGRLLSLEQSNYKPVLLSSLL